MKIVAGGVEYQLAPLKYADMRDLGKAGLLKSLARFGELEGWEVDDLVSEVVATSARRAGAKVTGRDLLEAADPKEKETFLEKTSEILAASGFVPAGGGSPNAESPGTGT